MEQAEEMQEPDVPSDEIRPATRPLYHWFALILVVNVVSLLWLAVRADSPAFVRGILDLFLHGAAGAVVVFLAFRALLRYPYYFADLLMIVLVLSGGMKLTVEFVNGLAAMGVIDSQFGSAERFGEIFQVCLFSASVLLAGAALGLRNCTLLNVKGTFWRGITLVSAMFVLPAAAGIAGFPVLMIREMIVRDGSLPDMIIFFVQWILSLGMTALNTVYFIRTLALNAEVRAQENMP
ncbi:MAG TPA: hypothetical protein VEK08_26325 [Planctomycetota bacterium]|nr:hypothetical protein [Planctomycetota bacterium]